MGDRHEPVSEGIDRAVMRVGHVGTMQGRGGGSFVSRQARRVARTLIVALILPIPAASVWAASPAAAPQAAAAQAAEVIEPVPAAEIAMRAEADEQFAQDVIGRAAEPDPTPALSAELDTLESGVRDLAGRYKRGQLDAMREAGLDTLARFWKLRNQQLARWKARIRSVGTRQSDDVAEIARRRATWEATRAAASASGLPPAMVTRANGVLEQIHLAERALAGPLSAQSRLSRRGNALQGRIDTALKEIDATRASIERRLMSLDAPSLLAAWGERPGAGAELASQKQRHDLELERQFLSEYVAFYELRLEVEAAVAIVILWLLLMARHRFRKQAEEARLARADAPILNRPISAWLLIVLVGVSYFEPDAPALARETLVLLALVPVLRLLPAAEYAVVKRWPYFTAALYLLYEAKFLLVDAPLLERLHLIGVGVLAILVVLYLLAQLRVTAAAGKATAYTTLVRSIGQLFMAALVAGLAANAAGNVSLAMALTGGAINSGYAGLAIYAAVGVLRALLVQLTTGQQASQSVERAERRRNLAQSVTGLLRAAAFVAWMAVTLAGFRILRPVAEALRSVLGQPIAIGSFNVTLGGVLVFVACVLTSLWIAQGVRFVLRDEVLPQVRLPRGAANSISTLSYYAVVLAGLLVALLAAGLEPSQLTIVLGALGVGLGFGLQGVVNNVLSGLILMFERPIQPGDTIAVAGVEGTVGEIAMRATRVRTFDGADVFVPNGALLADKLVNWTLAGVHRRFDVDTGVAYGSDMPKVFGALLKAAHTTPGLSTPEPMVMFTGFGESSLDFKLRVWTRDNDRWVAIRSALTLAVHDALLEAGIQIPFPQRDLHLRSVSPQARADLIVSQPAVVSKPDP